MLYMRLMVFVQHVNISSHMLGVAALCGCHPIGLHAAPLGLVWVMTMASLKFAASKLCKAVQ